MIFGSALLRDLACLALLGSCTAAANAQTPLHATSSNQQELKFVVYLSRHGVRSPTGKTVQYNLYSGAGWPTWNVPPGYLTAHGYRLMQIFGAYDRALFAQQGLLSARGCQDRGKVTIYADSDQRTRETGRALAEGLFPDCPPSITAKTEGVTDPLFHPLEADAVTASSDLAVAAIAGRIGGNPGNLTEAYRTQLKELDQILARCGVAGTATHERTSIFDVPAALSPRSGGHAAELRGPLSTSSTLTENLLLEYAEGMPASSVGWGCVDESNLGSLLELHTAASDFTQRTPAIARQQASNLLDHLRRAILQAAERRPIAGAIARPDDKVLFLVGHDTNISNVAGLLDLTWIADGRRDDTPPGGALVFELWGSKETQAAFVRIYYTTQTLEQMRSESALSLENQPVRVPVFLPGCSRADFSCSLAGFEQTVARVIDPASVINH